MNSNTYDGGTAARGIAACTQIHLALASSLPPNPLNTGVCEKNNSSGE